MTFFDTSDLKTDEITLRLDHCFPGDSVRNWVPAYYFDIMDHTGQKLGICDLRIGHNEGLYYGGNIGYAVDEPHRGHHYAAKACRLLFRQARKHGLGYVIITCDPTNTASSRTCELADGEYLETADIPEDHDMYERGLRQVMVYRFDLDRGENEDGTN